MEIYQFYVSLCTSCHHSVSCYNKIRVICIYPGCTKVITDYWDIRLSVTINFIGYYFRNNWTDLHDQTCIGISHQTVSDNMLYIIWKSVYMEIQAYQCSYLLKLAWYLL